MKGASIILPEAIDADGIMSLRKRLIALESDETTTSIILEGANGIFCKGLRLASLHGIGAPARTVFAALHAFGDCLRILRRSGKPTLALVDGDAIGGGLGIAAACDVIVASDKSRFSLPEVLFGFLPAIVWPILIDRISMHKCRVWALTGESRSADEALRDGLVDQVVARDRLHDAGRRWVRRLSRGTPSHLAEFKLFAAEPVEHADTALQKGVELTSRALRDPSVLRRLRDFEEAGIPPWERE
jgi:enoyl-CoA hydratase/carnithine racemase